MGAGQGASRGLVPLRRCRSTRRSPRHPGPPRARRALPPQWAEPVRTPQPTHALGLCCKDCGQRGGASAGQPPRPGRLRQSQKSPSCSHNEDQYQVSSAAASGIPRAWHTQGLCQYPASCKQGVRQSGPRGHPGEEEHTLRGCVKRFPSPPKELRAYQ